jgi:hypothetical protein
MNNGATPSMILRGLDSLVDLLARSGLSHDFIRFGIVGTLGLVWDTATVYAVKGFAGLYVAGACGFVVAATINWAINRFWTFRHLDHTAAQIAAIFSRQLDWLHLQPRHVFHPGDDQPALPGISGAGHYRRVGGGAGV